MLYKDYLIYISQQSYECVILLYSSYRWSNRGTESVKDLPKVAQLANPGRLVWSKPLSHARLCLEQLHRHSTECLLKLYFYLCIYLFYKLYLNTHSDSTYTIGSSSSERIWIIIKGLLKWTLWTHGKMTDLGFTLNNITITLKVFLSHI